MGLHAWIEPIEFFYAELARGFGFYGGAEFLKMRADAVQCDAGFAIRTHDSTHRAPRRLKRSIKEIIDRFQPVLFKKPRSRAREMAMTDRRRILALPCPASPSEPLVPTLSKHEQRLITKLRKFGSPTGTAFNGIVLQDLADDIDFLAAVYLVPDALQDFSHQYRVVVLAIHQSADVFETHVAVLQFLMGQYPDAPGT